MELIQNNIIVKVFFEFVELRHCLCTSKECAHVNPSMIRVAYIRVCMNFLT